MNHEGQQGAIRGARLPAPATYSTSASAAGTRLWMLKIAGKRVRGVATISLWSSEHNARTWSRKRFAKWRRRIDGAKSLL
jgi:hypothetical protein